MSELNKSFLGRTIPTVEEIKSLQPGELKSVMAVYAADDDRGKIEARIREIFLWAALNRASDVHIVGKGEKSKPDVQIAVRTNSGLIFEEYKGESGRVFEEKLFQLGTIPQGGSTPSIISSRFRMNIPVHLAQKYGLTVNEDARYYVVNIRMEYSQTYDGFSFVCRLLDAQRIPKFHELGLPFTLMKVMEEAMESPSGLFLVSGPTGSGKTTLLNAILDYLNDGTRAISTAEDPVEYGLQGGPVKQMQIGGDITFPRALRSILRQDPDIILIGEIRDFETLKIAIEAAQTGHMVFATIHSNSAEETIQRMMTMYVNEGEKGEEVLADNIRFIVSQRLLTRYKGEMVARTLTGNEKDWLTNNGLPLTSVYNGLPLSSEFMEVVPELGHDGRKQVIGYMPVVEAIAMTDEIRIMVRNGSANPSDIYKASRNQIQYETLAEAGLRGVQSNNCLLSDCIKSLTSNTLAKSHPSKRVQLSQLLKANLARVSTMIDAEVRHSYQNNGTFNIDETRLEMVVNHENR